MVDADFIDGQSSTNSYALPENSVELQTDGNKGFSTFKCEHSVDVSLKCSKLQYWPASSYSEGFRFEKGNRVEAYYYDFKQDGLAKWKNNRSFFLEGANNLVYGMGALAAMLVTF